MPSDATRPVDDRGSRDEAVVEFESTFFRAVADATPARRTVGERLGSTNECDFAVTKRVQMLEGEMASDLVWHALAPAFPERLTAGSFVSVCSTSLALTHPDTGLAQGVLHRVGGDATRPVRTVLGATEWQDHPPPP